MLKRESIILTVKVGVDSVLQIGAGPKVDQFQVEALEVDEKVFILDVAVDDALAVAGNDGLNNLAEKVASKLLLQHALLSDEVKQVLARSWLLHDIDEGVMALIEVQELDYSRDGLDLPQELELQRDSSAIQLQNKGNDP